MSWNPAPILNTANWQGGTQLATKRQLVSSISSLQSQISSISGSTINTSNTSTGTISSLQVSQLWNVSSIQVSTPTLITTIISSQSVLTSSITANTLSGNLTGNVSGTTNGAVTATSLNATGSIDFNNNSIRQFSGGYTSTGGIAIGSYQNIQVKASTNIALLADRGADITGSAVLDLTAQYGGGSQINLTAKSGSVLAPVPTAQVNITAQGNTTLAPSLAPIGGAVNITANAGSGSGTALVGYGQIYMTANSFNTTTQPGFIAASAGANAMYAGTFSPFAGLGQVYGNNYIWGQAGNSFVCSPTTPTFPAVVGSNYFYAALGALGGYSVQIAGNRMRGGIGTDFIQPFPTLGDLYIQGDQAGNMIQISSVKVLNMSTTGAITGVGDINLSSINGGSYVSTIPSTVSVVTLNASSLIASTASISTLTTGTITLSSINGGSYLSTIPSAVSVVTLTASSLIASTGSISTLTTGNINLSSINNLPYTDPAGNAPYISSYSVSTGTLTASTITATTFVSTKSLIASTLTTTQLFAPLGSISSLTVSSLSAGILTGSTIINSIITNNVLTSTMTNTGGIIFTTPSTIFDLSKTVTLSTISATALAQYRNKILTYELDGTATTELVVTYVAPQSQIYYFFWDQVGTWGGVTNTFLAGQSYIRVNIGIFGTAPETGFIDIYNSNQSAGLDVYYFTTNHTLVTLGATVRFSWVSQGASIGTWTVTPSPSVSTTTTQTNFTITQGYADTTIAGSDIVNINATSLYLNAPLTQAQRIYASDGYYSTLQTEFISTGVLRVNTISSASVSVTGDLTATGTITAPIMTGTFYANAPIVYGTTSMVTPLVSTNLINVTSANPYVPTSVTSFTETITTQLPAPSISSRYNVSEVDYNLSFVRPVYNQTLGTANVVTIRPDYTLYVNGTYTGVNAISTVINFTPVDNSSVLNISTFAFNGSFTAQTNSNAIPFTFAGTSGSVLANTYKEFRYISPSLTTPSGAKPSPWLSPTAVPSKLQVSLGANQVYVSTPTIFFNNKQIQTFTMNCPGTIENQGLYGKGTGQNVASFNGQVFPVADYNCLASVSYVNIYGQLSLAINEQAITTSANGDGNWYIQTTVTTATIPNATHPAFDFFVGLTMIPKELGGATNFQSPAHLGEESWSPMNIPGAILSSITASTLTFNASENIAMVANVAVPSFVSTGSIYIAGSKNTNLLGNITAVGGYTDVDIDALAGAVNITATAGDINLSANGKINVGSSIIRGSNSGSMLGNFQPMKFVYEPPTATGQSAEFAIQAHPQDAGVVFNLRYGVNLAGGYGYLLCEWPGYIVVPMKIYGQDIALEGGETVHINANSGNVTITATATTYISSPVTTINSPTINTYGDFYFNGATLHTQTGMIDMGGSGSLYGANNIRGKYITGTAGNTPSYSPVSPLALINGNGSGRSQIQLEYWDGGGYTHYISTRHDGGSPYGNSIDFWIYNYGGGGGGSTTPGTGNTKRFSVTATGASVYGETVTNSLVVGAISILPQTTNGYSIQQIKGGNTYGYLFGDFTLLGDGIHLCYNAYGSNGAWVNPASYQNSRISLGYGSINFYVGDTIGSSTAGPNTLALHINSSGYLGVNTIYPEQPLHVEGNTRINGNLYIGGIHSISGYGGALSFDGNIGLSGTGSNYNGLYNGDGYIRLNNYQNVELKGAGGHLGGEDQIIVHGLIYSDSRIYTGTSGQGFLHQNGSGFIQTRVDYGVYGGLTMNGYFQVCQTGTTSAIFTVPSDTNGSMRYNNGTGGFGIGTTTPAYRLDVNGTAKATLGIVAGSSDIARLILGPTPGTGNYDYCSLIQSESYTAGNYGSKLSFWTHPNAGNYGDPTERMRIEANGNTIFYGSAFFNNPITLLSSSYLDLNGKTVYGTSNINFYNGGSLSSVIPGGHSNADIILTGTGGDSAITLTNGTSEIQMNANNDLIITPTTGKNILLNGPVTTVLSSTAISQPVIQYGETTGSGTSGSATVTLPVPYTSSTSYVVFASMMDTTECKISVNRDSSSQITIYWSQGGSGSHKLGWNTMGV